MPTGSNKDIPQPIMDGRLSVLVELKATPGASPITSLLAAESFGTDGFRVDENFSPVTMVDSSGASEGMSRQEPTYIIRGTVSSEEEIAALRQRPEVADVWLDTPIAPFPQSLTAPVTPDQNLGSAACPIGSCDCQPGTPKGTISDVATYLGVNKIWTAGFRGAGIVVGVLDSGITAQGRPVKAGETSRRIPRVVDGWPADWGTESGKWGEHGNMCATDVLGMAPEAQLYDFRIAGAGGSPGTISRALQAVQWAIDRHRVDGTPHILTNSWGIFQEAWDTTYARNPNHPFTRKIVEAIDEGIAILFAAGNCGATCPDGRCGPDNGSGRSIWGANSHPRVMTVGAVNRLEQLIGYSSQGPGALDSNKPDFCSISHFQGYFASDSGTSAATPILAGLCALLKQAKPTLTPEQLKSALIQSCKNMGTPGFDVHSGHGIVQGKATLDRVRRVVGTTPVTDLRTTVATETISAQDRVTTVIRDRLHTQPSTDLLKPVVTDTIALRDRVVTGPAQDLTGSTPASDPIGTLQERIGDPRLPRERGFQQPFVLSTPHHAQDWRYFDDIQADDGALALLDQITELSAALDEMVQQYHSMTQGTPFGGSDEPGYG